jgi:putative transposase
MVARKVPLLVGEYYHIYNRGVDKRTVFLDEHDYQRFITLLYLCNGTSPVNMREYFENSKTINKGRTFVDIFSVDRGERLVGIGVYALMPNHFHILVREKMEGGVSIFMQKLSTAYSMYFNRKYERKGSLFEGKFKAKHINNEPYFYWMFSYTHLNAVNLVAPNWKEDGILDIEKVCKFIENYKYSSYLDYFIGDRVEGAILNKEEFPEHFSQLNDFGDLVQSFRENS